MKKSILNLGKALNKIEQKNVFGGRRATELTNEGDTYNCKCNGHPIGTSSSSSGCAAKCYACVSSGGCQ